MKTATGHAVNWMFFYFHTSYQTIPLAQQLPHFLKSAQKAKKECAASAVLKTIENQFFYHQPAPSAHTELIKTQRP